ncbi:hypothetical protein DR871_014325 [Flavobacterium petrolei]|uniref:Uncharacterized protein n=1 Tax=Flavobacterium petrolei TaxID=2259594 RepID=A0A482TRZ9_9FLAO|nr:hypothetical protein [Flavobacterium petrolei]RYJ51094.1 hypothetical protein DR871_014325 [Flavobacterium petrolei]
MAENNQLTIKFGGDGNIKIETLTDFLDEYKDLLYLINTELGYKSDDLTIEVSPPENGSFKIKIKSKYKDLILDKLGDLSVGVLLGLIAIYSANSGNKKDLEEIKMILEQKEIKDKDVPNIVYNIYNNSAAQQKIQQTFIIVNNDENVTNLKIEHKESEIINIPKSEFTNLIKSLSVTELETIPQSDVLTDEATLIIKTIHFEGQAKWAFIFRGYLIKASIKDPNFINKLNNEAFRKGDALKVILSRKRNFDESLQTYIIDQNSYVIDKVIDHKSKTDDQRKINFE